MATLDELLQSKRTIICVGPGGVGKTTTSAALGVRAAQLGRKTLVLTVDPAHRLANSLGLSNFEDDEQRVELPKAILGPESVDHFHAMMLDTRRTFDGVVERYAPNPQVKERILSSKFYIQAATHLAGSKEYMAMEKLYEVLKENRYDLVILDTPPTAHALDFLDAPNRLEDFLDVNTSGLMAKSSRTLGKLGLGFLKANAMILKGVSKFMGTEVFLDILNFLNDFKEMYSGFKARAGEVKNLMRSRKVAFVILTSTERTSLDEGMFFQRRLTAEQMPMGAFVVNKFRTAIRNLDIELDEAGVRKELIGASNGQSDNGAVLAELTLKALNDYERLVGRDQVELERLRRMLGPNAEIVTVPEFKEDIHNLNGLSKYVTHLTA